MRDETRRDEVANLPRKTIEPAVEELHAAVDLRTRRQPSPSPSPSPSTSPPHQDLHAALDFADGGDLDALNEEAGASAAVSAAAAEGKVRAENQIRSGTRLSGQAEGR